jgi:hypothetical protein
MRFRISVVAPLPKEDNPMLDADVLAESSRRDERLDWRFRFCLFFDLVVDIFSKFFWVNFIIGRPGTIWELGGLWCPFAFTVCFLLPSDLCEALERADSAKRSLL